jgi:error-prone DNA polymerase
MQLAIDCAGFAPDEADRLRQAMSAKRAPERIAELRQRLLDGMAERGIGQEVAQDIYAKILAFSNYGFPESHAISFAYLVYASAWLKRYFPAAVTTALSNSGSVWLTLSPSVNAREKLAMRPWLHARTAQLSLRP